MYDNTAGINEREMESYFHLGTGASLTVHCVLVLMLSFMTVVDFENLKYPETLISKITVEIVPIYKNKKGIIPTGDKVSEIAERPSDIEPKNEMTNIPKVNLASMKKPKFTGVSPSEIKEIFAGKNYDVVFKKPTMLRPSSNKTAKKSKFFMEVKDYYLAESSENSPSKNDNPMTDRKRVLNRFTKQIEQPTYDEIITEYTDVIVTWVDRYKIIPNVDMDVDPRRRRTYVAKVFIRIDNSGNLMDYGINKSTGYRALDEAALRSVYAANPFPAPKDFFLEDDVLEFNVSIDYSI